MTHYALLGSLFLGPEVWEPTADALRDLGHAASVLTTIGDTPDEVLAQFAAELPVVEDVVLVPHSNAGLYVAGLAGCSGVSGVVFVDALLPGPAARTPVAPTELVAWLAPRVDAAGLLPAWTSWWPDSDVAELFTGPDQRVVVEAGQRRVPASYLSGVVPTPAGWERLPGAYVGFGDAYTEEQARARALGWPVRVLPGRHLHPLVAPVAVAAQVAARRIPATTGGIPQRD